MRTAAASTGAAGPSEGLLAGRSSGWTKRQADDTTSRPGAAATLGGTTPPAPPLLPPPRMPPPSHLPPPPRLSHPWPLGPAPPSESASRFGTFRERADVSIRCPGLGARLLATSY